MTPASPDMKALVEWAGNLDVYQVAPGGRCGKVRFVLHAVVDGDLLTLCGQLGADQLLPVPPGPVEVCPRCVAITEQLAAGLATHIHHDRKAQP